MVSCGREGEKKRAKKNEAMNEESKEETRLLFVPSSSSSSSGGNQVALSPPSTSISLCSLSCSLYPLRLLTLLRLRPWACAFSFVLAMRLRFNPSWTKSSEGMAVKSARREGNRRRLGWRGRSTPLDKGGVVTWTCFEVCRGRDRDGGELRRRYLRVG